MFFVQFMEPTLICWNRAVALSQPRLGDLEKHLRLSKLVPVFSHTSSLLYAGDNLLITMPALEPMARHTCVESLSVILVADFFASNAQVRTSDLGPLEMFGLNLTLTAEAFLKELRRAGLGPLELATEPGRWTIRYGSALAFEFNALTPEGSSPAESKMVEINFNFRVPYRVPQRPNLSKRGQ